MRLPAFPPHFNHLRVRWSADVRTDRFRRHHDGERMTFFSPRGAAFALALTSLAGGALAQSPVCDRYRAELASLEQMDTGRSREYEAAAQRQQAELARTAAYARQLGCDRQQFLFFGEAPPPECGPLRGRMAQMQANLRQLMAQADGGGVESRRRFLLAAINQNCGAGGVQQARPRGFFEQLFGGGPQEVRQPPGGYPVDANGQPVPFGEQPLDEARLGGGKTVCVRTCDGFFFPLASSPGGRAGANEMCQALCPGAEAEAFSMGEEIKTAVSLRGTPYMNLPNALKYTRSFDASCSCKGEGQSWAQALRNAEALLDKRKTDIYVTEAKAEELSRAQPARPDPKKPAPRNAREQAQAQVEAVAAAEAAAGAQAPTASTDSSGIGPRNIGGVRAVTIEEGQRREVQRPDGTRTTVRVIGSGQAPTSGPVPQ